MKFHQLALRNLKEVYRDKVTMLLGIAMPVGFLVLFSSIQKGIQLDIFKPASLAPGIIVFCFAFLTMFCSVLIAKDRQNAFLIRLFTTPLKPKDYILSYTLPFIPLAILQTIICFIIAVCLGAQFSNIFAESLILMIVAFIFIFLGVIFGSLFTLNQVSAVGSIFITIASLFSGAWMDLKMIGGVFNSFGYALPFAHAVDLSRALLSGRGISGLYHSLWVVIGYVLVLAVASYFAFRKAMKKI
jgi:ABC-2 type transport system permease protein